MSKAFTREDDSDAAPLRPRTVSSLPAGVPNYLTQAGAERFRTELDSLQKAKASFKPGTAEAESAAYKIADLQEILRSAVVVPPPDCSDGKIRFGARVTVREGDGTLVAYRIVGVDEVDLEANDISWRSPLARALLNRSKGEQVRFRSPAGEQQLEIIAVEC